MDNNTITTAEFHESDGCTNVKAHESLRGSQASNDASLITILVKDTMRLFFAGEVEGKLKEIEDIVAGGYAGMSGIDCDMAEQKRIKKIAKMLYRRIHSEYRIKGGKYHMTISPVIEFDGEFLPNLTEAYPKLEYSSFKTSSIDVVFDDGETMEGIVFKSGKPWLSERGKRKPSENKQMYMLLQALKTLVPEGEQRTVKLTYEFMQKRTDTALNNWVYEDFYDGSGNVVSIEDVFLNTTAGRALTSVLDESMLENIKTHDIGHECPAEECEKCFLNCICNFVATPEVMEKKEIKKGKKISPSEVQQKIIDFDKGVLQVIAGAGSGKTEVAAEHIKKIIMKDMENGLTTSDICRGFLMTTFTNAGVSEMKDRIVGKMNGILTLSQDDLNICTFNTFAFNIVKEFYTELGFTKEPVVIDDTTNKKRIALLLSDNPISGLEYENFNAENGALNVTVKAMELIKVHEIDPDDEEAEEKLENVLASEYSMRTNITVSLSQVAKDFLAMYREYNSYLLEDGFITFADQEPMAIKMLDAHPDYLESLGIKHIVVDEFQDSNDIQMEMVKRLCSTSCFNELLVVGDDFQAIYSFRYTSPENMINFEEKLGMPVEKIFLVDNFRSTPEILALADSEIKNNKFQLPKELVAARQSIGKKPVVKGFYTKDDEVEYTVKLVKSLIEGGRLPEEIAIITMTNAELTKYNAALTQAGIATVPRNPQKYVENSRVKAAISLADAFWEPEATALYLPYLSALENGHLTENYSDEEILGQIAEMKSTMQSMDSYEIGYQRVLFHEWLDKLAGNDEIYQGFLDQLAVREDLPSELEFIQDFKKYGKDSAKRMDNAYQGVVLTTAHSAKGLEWPVVINSLSNYDGAMFHSAGGKKCESAALEERRRLLYVSMTRARDELYITSQYVAYGSEKEGYTYNQFLKEIMDITGDAYVPVDPEADLKKAEAKKRQAERAKEAREKKKEHKAALEAYLAHLKVCG